MRQKQAERQVAINALRKMIKPGDTVYTIIRHVSKSGMSRGIDLYIIKKNRPIWITGYVGQAIDQPQSRKDWESSRGLRVSGCGMDMGFHVVYSLGRVLFPKGFVPAKIGRMGRNGTDSTVTDTDGGYAIDQAWI